MAKVCYEHRSFNNTQLGVIETADRILNSYARQGYRITLRTLYYQFIARDLFPDSRLRLVNGTMTKNCDPNYKWLGVLVGDARIAGLIDWDYLQDSGREHHGGDTGWGEPVNILQYGAEHYNITHWDGQEHYVEVWVEKQALEDIIARPCLEWNVKYFACKGYASLSAIREAAVRLRAIERREERQVTIIYLGDHDPSGIDMSRDIQNRLNMFGSNAEVVRIALNMDQVEEYNPPPSPTKAGDSRSGGYNDLYGDECWELDALEPQVLNDLIEGEITSRIDMSLWQPLIVREEEERGILVAMHSNYEEILEYMREQGMVA